MGLLGDTTQADYYINSDSWGKYQFTSLDNIVNQFMIAYVGEDKLISKIKRTDVAYYAQRAIQELSFDTFKSCKTKEIEIPASLTMILPQDYVNYVKLTWSDSAGIEHVIYPTSKTSNPIAINQYPSGEIMPELLENNGFDTDMGSWHSYNNPSTGTPAYTWNSNGYMDANAERYAKLYQTSTDILAGHTYRVSYDLTITQGEANILLVADDSNADEQKWNSVSVGTVDGSYTRDITVDRNALTSDTWSNYKSATPSENQDDYQDDTYWPMAGRRYGLDPQHAQANGSFYMDCNTGLIHFSSNISGKTVILEYISDGLGTDDEMVVHKFAEEAMYKWIAYAILSVRTGVPEYVINRYKKEKFAETRKAKLRLSNIKLEEITQVLRGKSKQIKH